MIFSIYQDSIKPYKRDKETQFVPINDEKVINNGQKQSLSKEKKLSLEYSSPIWLKKKSSLSDQMNKLGILNTTTNSNFAKMPLAKFFLKNRTVLKPKQTQQTPSIKQRQKRIHSQPDFSEQKKKKLQYDKFFNQTLIDTQHNFTGKNYLRQVENFKLSSLNKQQSPKKLFLSTKAKLFQNSISSTFLIEKPNKLSKNLQSCINEQGSQSLLMNKRLSLNERLLIKKSPQPKEKSQQKSLIQCNPCQLNDKLRKQIQKNVKDDIKAQINKFKKSKLIKFKFKDNSYKAERRPLKITEGNKEGIFQNFSEDSPQIILNCISQYNHRQINSKQRRQGQVIKKSHSSFNNYQEKEKKQMGYTLAFPVNEELNPWDSDTVQFCGFR